MAEREICSPVSIKGSKVGSGQPMSPGARSSPSRGSRGPVNQDSVPPQTSQTSRHSAEDPLPTATTTVVGPEE